jgi:hypothetical protein
MIKLERLKFETEPAYNLRREQNGGRLVHMDHSTYDRKRKKRMDKKVGMWLNRNKAVIITIIDNVEGRRIITSDMEHYFLYSTVVPGDGSPEEIRARRFWNHLGEYYDKIIADIRGATAIQIFGPEVAKYELQKHLESEGISEYIVSIENAEKMTDLKISEKVLKRFPLRSRFDLS